MRRHLLLVALLLAGALPAEARAASCLTRGQTLAATERIRVFATHHGGVYHVCDLRRRRSREIGVDWEGPEGVHHAHFTAAGRIVAYEFVTCDRFDGCEGRVDVEDGTDRRRKWPSGPVPGAIADLRVNRLGQVAYAVKAPDLVSVYAITRRKAQRLASGSAVDPFSLALGDGVVYWTDAGTAMSRLL